MELIILGHIILDFYVQTDKIADKKKIRFKYMLLHCLIYTVGMYIVFMVTKGILIQGIIVAIIIGITHICIDMIKANIELKRFKSAKSKCILFLLDQIIHIAILLMICFFFNINVHWNNFSLFNFSESLNAQKIIIILIAGLICWKPTAIFISLVFNIIPKTVKAADADELNEKAGQDEVIKIGSWIGVLEREIILLLGLLGQYGAIGFVLTAKSIARYKLLEEKNFAEKYLVGTLLSAFVAISCVAICSLVK